MQGNLQQKILFRAYSLRGLEFITEGRHQAGMTLEQVTESLHFELQARGTEI